MKRLLLLLLVAMPASPLCADSMDVSVWISTLDFHGNLIPGPLANDFRVSLRDDVSLSANLGINFTDHLALELGGSLFRSEASFFAFGLDAASLGEVQIVPLTATVRIDMLPHAEVDPYVGAGVAYFLFDMRDQTILDARGTPDLEIEDDIGYTLVGGLNLNFTPRVAIGGEIRYLRVDTNFGAANRTPLPLRLEPVVSTLGFRVKF